MSSSSTPVPSTFGQRLAIVAASWRKRLLTLISVAVWFVAAWPFMNWADLRITGIIIPPPEVLSLYTYIDGVSSFLFVMSQIAAYPALGWSAPLPVVIVTLALAIGLHKFTNQLGWLVFGRSASDQVAYTVKRIIPPKRLRVAAVSNPTL